MDRFLSKHFGKLLLLTIWAVCGAFMIETKTSEILWVPVVSTFFWAISS